MNTQARVLEDIGTAAAGCTSNALQGAISIEVAKANARIAELEAKLALANKPRKATCKVTEKGGLSLYGLGRFPVTLYRGQWERLLGMADDIKSFIKANADRLTTKE